MVQRSKGEPVAGGVDVAFRLTRIWSRAFVLLGGSRGTSLGDSGGLERGPRRGLKLFAAGWARTCSAPLVHLLKTWRVFWRDAALPCLVRALFAKVLAFGCCEQGAGRSSSASFLILIAKLLYSSCTYHR